jgi:acyl-CoA dehydrogenase
MLNNLRRNLISRPILQWYRRVLPAMSDTEREALQAGTVWWDAELFSGRPRWEKFLGYTKPQLSAAEQAFIDGPVEELCRMLDDWQINQQRDLPPAVWDFIRQNRLFGMIIPKSYGGLGFSALAHSTVVMKISARSLTTGVTVMVPNSLGPAELLLHYGTEQQKQHYLPRLADGREIPCFALTGPHSGSDAAAMRDRGVVCYDEFQGERTLGLRISWDKRYITLAPVATVLGLAFRLHDPDHLLGDEEDLGITLALIPTNTPGVNIGRRHYPARQAFMNGPTSAKDVFIPLQQVIGERAGIGRGWHMLMDCLSAGR